MRSVKQESEREPKREREREPEPEPEPEPERQAPREPMAVTIADPPPWGVTFETDAAARLVVAGVTEGGVAHRHGLRHGMVLTSVNAKRVVDSAHGLRLLQSGAAAKALGFDEPPPPPKPKGKGLKRFKKAGLAVVAARPPLPAAGAEERLLPHSQAARAPGPEAQLEPEPEPVPVPEPEPEPEPESGWQDSTAQPKLVANDAEEDEWTPDKAGQSLLMKQQAESRAQAVAAEETKAAIRRQLCGLWLADGQQSRVDVKVRLFISLEDSPDGDEPELMGYRYPETFRDVSILVDFELVEKLGGKWHLSFREVFAGARPTINWEVRSVRCQAAGYFDERALKQGLWTHRQDMAEAEGGGWFHAKDSFEAEWVGEEEPPPRVYIEPNQSRPAADASAIVWKARLAELRADHHGQADPTFRRYIRAFPGAMDDDVLMESHRVLLGLPSGQPQCRGCHYCKRAMRRKHVDRLLSGAHTSACERLSSLGCIFTPMPRCAAGSTLDGAERQDARAKLIGIPPRPLGVPLLDVQTWPAPQSEFPRALFPLQEFNSSALDAAGNTVLDRVRALDLEDAVGSYIRRPKPRRSNDAGAQSGSPSTGSLDCAVLTVRSGSWHRMAKPDGTEVFVIYNFSIQAADVEIYQFAERYSSALHKHSTLAAAQLLPPEAVAAFPSKEWWRNMVDDDANVVRRGEQLRSYFESICTHEALLKHPKARSILGYNYAMLEAHLLESQHGHWIEHDLKARSAVERANGDLDFVPVQRLSASRPSSRPAGAMAVVVNAVETMGLKVSPDAGANAAPRMDIGVLHAQDGAVAEERPVPVQRVSVATRSYATDREGVQRMGVSWEGGMRIFAVRPLERDPAMLGEVLAAGSQGEAPPPPVLALDVLHGKQMATVHIVLDWDSQEGVVDHWYELVPPVHFKRDRDHSRTVDAADERRYCEHGALRLQILLLYQVAAGSVVDLSAPIVMQISQALFNSKTRERLVVDRLNQVFEEEFKHSRIAGFLQVKICRARELPPLVSDRPRVYCAVELEEQLYLTKTVESASMAPEWDHALTFSLTDVGSVLSVSILQRETGNHEHDSLYGEVQISPSHFIGDPHTATAFRRWYSVQNNDLDEPSGQVELKFFYVPKHQDELIVVDDLEDAASHVMMRRATKVLHQLSLTAQQSEQSASTLGWLVDGLGKHRCKTELRLQAANAASTPIGSLRVAVIKGDQMPKMDEFGDADPYCIVRFGKSEERTPTVFQSLEPVWESNDGGNEFIFDVRSLEQNIVVAIWDEDENDADDFMCEVSIPISELPVGEVTEAWYDCEPVGRIYVQTGLTLGHERAASARELQELQRRHAEEEETPSHFRYSMSQAELLLEKTFAYEEDLEKKVETLESQLEDERLLVRKAQERLYNYKHEQSAKRKEEREHASAQRRASDAVAQAVEAWNAVDDSGDDSFCEKYCDCLLEVPIPTVLRVCYGIYGAMGVLTVILGWMVHKRIGYVEPLLSRGVVGTGVCMSIIGPLVALTAGRHERWYLFFALIFFNALQLIVLGFVGKGAEPSDLTTPNKTVSAESLAAVQGSTRRSSRRSSYPTASRTMCFRWSRIGGSAAPSPPPTERPPSIPSTPRLGMASLANPVPRLSAASTQCSNRACIATVAW